MTSYPSSYFTWNRESRNFVTEASDLIWHSNVALPNFYIMSDRTGAYSRFSLCFIEHDEEGDILAWYYSPDRDTPAYGRVNRVIVYND